MASAAIHYATTATIKPSRSEDLVDPQQQILIEEAVRRKFDEEAPKRHRKPLRSDIDSDGNVQTEYFDDLNDDHEMPPEYIKLQSLVHDSADQHVVQEYPSEVPEEFVETEYYKDLNSVDQSLHHATGTGFIQVENSSMATSGFDLKHTEETVLVRTKSQSNPATNDWIPSLDTVSIPASDKPHRSEP